MSTLMRVQSRVQGGPGFRNGPRADRDHLDSMRRTYDLKVPNVKVLAVGLVVVALPACVGSGGGGTLTPTQYRREANAVCARLNRLQLQPPKARTFTDKFATDSRELRQALSTLQALRPLPSLVRLNARVDALDSHAVDFFASIVKQLKAGTITPQAAVTKLGAYTNSGRGARETALWKKLGVGVCVHGPRTG
jgi:hypothetical protein